VATPPPMTPLQQAVARNNADAFARMQDKILPETWELNRWMLASLLAINSAAGAAVYAAASVPLPAKIVACWFFIAGAVTALVSGFSLTFVLRGMDAAVSNAQHYWAAVAGGGARSEEQEQSHQAAVLAANRLSAVPQLLLYASLVLFLVGITRL
jgi:hypothetical protein